MTRLILVAGLSMSFVAGLMSLPYDELAGSGATTFATAAR